MMNRFFITFKKYGIYIKLIGLVFVFFSFLFFIFFGFYYYQLKNFLIEKDSEQLVSESRWVSAKIVSDVTSLENYFSFIASHNQIIRDAVAVSNSDESLISTEDILTTIESGVAADLAQMSLFPIFNVLAINKKGVVVAAADKPSAFYFGDKPQWPTIVRTVIDSNSSLVYSDINPESGLTALNFVLPIVGSNSEMVGYLQAIIDYKELFRVIFKGYASDSDYVGVTSSEGKIIFDQDTVLSKKEILPLLNNLFLRKNSQKIIKDILLGSSGKSFIINFSQINMQLSEGRQEYYMYCVCSADKLFGPLRKMSAQVVSIWFFMISVFFIVFLFMIVKILKPLQVLREGFRQVQAGNFQYRVGVESKDEFEALAKDFNMSMEKLQQTVVSQEYFNRIVHSISDLLFVVDENGKIVTVNNQMCSILGFSQDELVGMDAIKLFVKKDRYVVGWGLKGLVEDGILKDKRVHLFTKAGKEVEIYLGTRSLWNADKKLAGLVCLGKDLTEINRLLVELKASNEETEQHKKDLEKSLLELTDARDAMLSILEDTDFSNKSLESTLLKLREAQDELVQAEKMVSLGQIAAGVAHEINNPLFVISGESEILGLDESLPESVKESVKVIRDQIKRINDIIKRLLEFSRKRESKFGFVDVNELVIKTTELLGYQVKIVGFVEVIKKFANEPLWVNGDYNQLQEVFLNIMINAVQAMEESGGVLTIEVFSEIIQISDLVGQIKFAPGDKMVSVRISDTGAGMDEETLKKVFDPFFTTKKTGTGLGLSVCFGIIENHGGFIQVESQKNQGTAFLIRMRQVQPNT